MNTLHHVRFASGVLSTGGPLQPATRLLGYVDVNQAMAAKYGRQMSPMAIFDLVAYRADVQIQDVDTGAFDGGIGAGVQGNINYVAPGRTRVRALEEARERWHAEVLETDITDTRAQLSRDRQFYPKYDDEMPSPPYASPTELASGLINVFVMIDRGIVANHWGIFSDWNARHPRWPAPTVTQDGIVPADPRLYTFPASEIEEVLGFRAYSSMETGSTTLTTDLWTGVSSHADYIVAPAGRAWPILLGLMRVEIDEITPPENAIQDDVNFVVLLDFYFSGWRPIAGGAKGIRSSRRR